MTDDLCLHVETLWISPYVFSSFVALTEKRLEFKTFDVQLIQGEHLNEGYRDRSLTARVPCLERGSFALSESSAIAEYLEECHPPPQYARLFPENREDRARCRQIMAWLRSDLGALREERSTVTMFYKFRLAPLTVSGGRDMNKLLRVAASLIPQHSGPMFGEWCLADSELAFMLHRLLLNGHPVPGHMRAYAEREWQRPSVQAYVGHARPREVPNSYWGYSGTPRLEPLGD